MNDETKVTPAEPTAFAPNPNPPPEESKESGPMVRADEPATKEDIDGLRDAIKTLTTEVIDLKAENTKWFKAGKMGG